MYSFLNIVLSAWFLSVSHAEPGLMVSTQNWVTLLTQQMIVPEERRILALRSDANDFVLQPVLPITQLTVAAVTDVGTIQSAASEEVSTEVIDTGPSITVLAAPKPIAPKPVTSRPVEQKAQPVSPKPVITPAAAPVVRPTVNTPVVQAPATLAAATPVHTPVPTMVYTPPPTPVAPIAPVLPPATPAPQLVATTRVSGPTLVAVDSSNITGYSITIPKLGLTSVPVIPSDARTDAGIRNLQGVAQVLYPAGTANHKTVIFGHSSNYSYVRSAYNEVFRYLDRLEPGDMVYVDINGQRLNYKVSKEEIVGAETPSIVTDYGREELVLFTCWPYKSSAKRYVTYLERQF